MLQCTKSIIQVGIVGDINSRGHKLASLTQPTPYYTIHQKAMVGDINWRTLRGLVYTAMYQVYHTGWYSRGHKLASLTQPTRMLH